MSWKNYFWYYIFLFRNDKIKLIYLHDDLQNGSHWYWISFRFNKLQNMCKWYLKPWISSYIRPNLVKILGSGRTTWRKSKLTTQFKLENQILLGEHQQLLSKPGWDFANIILNFANSIILNHEKFKNGR